MKEVYGSDNFAAIVNDKFKDRREKEDIPE